ncbi:radical SAM protein [Asanoa sp. NPDC049573]|uniref:radical SAM/SPASM domain-containing protein n=1 Tax=Asanoa sp. NPDC049573 TaxID=3155396 RepID=UPI00341AEF0D
MGYERAVVLSSADLHDGQRLMVHNCEDCACAVTEALAEAGPVPSFDTGPWVRAAELVDLPLDAGRRLLFNPLGRGGVVVVNEPASQLVASLASPSIVDSADDAVRKLAALELIHPVSTPVRPSFGTGTMLTAWLHVTNACNLRCPYCYVDKTAEKMEDEVGYASVDAILRSAVDNGFRAVKLKYAGGEASLNHHLVRVLHAYVRERALDLGLELHATLLSNGVRLPDPFVDELTGAGVRIMVSLDGVGDSHDAQRPFVSGKPSFHHVERTIDRLVSRGHRPHLSITVTNRNADDLPAAVRFALERDLTFSLNFFRDNDCAASFTDLRYEEQGMISALLKAFEVVEEFLPPWSVLGAILDRGQLVQPRERSCGVGQDYVVIDQRGGVAKCHMEIERTLGDVFTDDPLRLVRSDQRTVLNLAVDEKEGCRTCTWRYWCSGGCAVATFRATGRYDVKSPNCNIYKAIYPAALRLEGLRLLKYAGEQVGS